MKYLILPAKNLQCGDVVFTTNKEGPICARVLGQNYPHPEPGISEYRVQIVVGDKESEEGTHTVLKIQHESPLGVAREDDFVTVDVAAILSALED